MDPVSKLERSRLLGLATVAGAGFSGDGLGNSVSDTGKSWRLTMRHYLWQICLNTTIPATLLRTNLSGIT